MKWNFTNSQVHVNWFLYSLSNQIHRMLEVIECICGAENKHNDKLYLDKHYCSEQRLITESTQLPWVRVRRTVPLTTRKDTSRQRMKVLAPCVQMIDKQWDVHSQPLPLCGPTRYWYWIQIIIWAVKKKRIIMIYMTSQTQSKSNTCCLTPVRSLYVEGGASRSWRPNVPQRSDTSSSKNILWEYHHVFGPYYSKVLEFICCGKSIVAVVI